MHVITILEEDFPKSIDGPTIDNFIQHISAKVYDTPIHPRTGWSQPRAREIRLFEFTIPEQALDEFLKDLASYEGGKLTRLKKIFEVPIIGKKIKDMTGIHPVDVKAIRADLHKKGELVPKKFPIRTATIGYIEDGHTENGKEIL